MKTLFAHDFRLIKDSETGEFYNNTFNYQLWKRYLNFSSQLVVVSRLEVTDIDKKKNLKISSGKNVEFVSVPNLSNPLKRYSQTKIAKKIILKQLLDVDGVVVRLPSEIGLLTYNLALSLDVPVAIEMVGCPEESYKYHGSLAGKLYSPIAGFKYRKAIREAKFTLYVTKEYLQNKYPTNGLKANASNVNIKVKKENQYAYKKEKKTEISIGIVGSLNVDYKGFDIAIAALSLLNKEDAKHTYHLDVVGEGDPSRWIKIAKTYNVENLINFKGKVKHEELLLWLQTIDLYIQPSKTEGLPRAVIEAMNEGLPVVASKVGGIPELIDEKFLHVSSDYREMSQKISLIINNIALKREQSQRNFVKVKEYDRSNLEDKREDFYRKFATYIKKNNSTKV